MMEHSVPHGVCTCSGLPNALRLSHTETALEGSLLIITKGSALTATAKPMLGRATGPHNPPIISCETLAPHKPCLQGGVSVRTGDILPSTLP